MATIITAKYVYVQNDSNLIMVGFADRQYETTEYVLLQKSKMVSEEERKLGQDRVYITINDQLRSAYGGIERVEMSPHLINIHLDTETAKKLSTEKEILVNIQDETYDMNELHGEMSQMFKDDPAVLLTGKWDIS